MTDQPVSWLLVEPGWAALARDGERVGTVAAVVGDSDKDIFDGLAVDVEGVRGPRYVAAESVGPIVDGAVTLELSADAARELPEHEPSVGLRILPDSGPRAGEEGARR